VVPVPAKLHTGSRFGFPWTVFAAVIVEAQTVTRAPVADVCVWLVAAGPRLQWAFRDFDPTAMTRASSIKTRGRL